MCSSGHKYRSNYTTVHVIYRFYPKRLTISAFNISDHYKPLISPHTPNWNENKSFLSRSSIGGKFAIFHLPFHTWWFPPPSLSLCPSTSNSRSLPLTHFTHVLLVICLSQGTRHIHSYPHTHTHTHTLITLQQLESEAVLILFLLVNGIMSFN